MSTAITIARRDLLAIARSRSQLYSSMFTPLLFLLFLGVGVSRGLQPSNLPAGNFTAYLVAGAVVMTSVFSSTFASASYYRDRDSGLLRLMLSSPASPRNILLGKSLSALTVGTAQSLVVLFVAAPFVDFDWQHGIVPGVGLAIAAVALVNLMLTGLAQALASRIQTMQGFHLLMNLALFPLLFFSGAFFPIGDLPVWLRVLAYANPLTYAVDALELATYASSDASFIGLAIDFTVLGALAVATFTLGLGKTPKLTYSGE